MVGQAGEETMDLSLIVPCYNEAANLPTFFASATACFDATEYDYELVFVNDGSSDETMSVLSRAVESYRARGGRATVRILEFSRNFGKEAAMFAGLEQAAGDTIRQPGKDHRGYSRQALQRLFRFRSALSSYFSPSMVSRSSSCRA